MEIGCPTGDMSRLVNCLQVSRTADEIINASSLVRLKVIIETCTTKEWYFSQQVLTFHDLMVSTKRFALQFVILVTQLILIITNSEHK
jgi:hypothetical protein